MEVDERFSRLEAEIDAEFDSLIAQLEEQRKQRHDALKVLWPNIVATFGLQETAPTVKQDAPETDNEASDEKRKPFPMRQAIRDIINGLEENAEFNQPGIYDELLRSYSELRESPPPNIRAQIASVLNWLTHKAKLITVAREGRGSVPNIYRKRTKDELLFDSEEEILDAEAEYRAARQRYLTENMEGVNK